MNRKTLKTKINQSLLTNFLITPYYIITTNIDQPSKKEALKHSFCKKTNFIQVVKNNNQFNYLNSSLNVGGYIYIKPFLNKKEFLSYINTVKKNSWILQLKYQGFTFSSINLFKTFIFIENNIYLNLYFTILNSYLMLNKIIALKSKTN